MHNVITIGLAAFIGYFLGSISFAVLVSRCYGTNILKVGSGNPGASNVKRTLGKVPGNLVFCLDFLKGSLAVAWPLLFWRGEASLFYIQVGGIIGVILGHSFSIFLKFQGGKGVASTMGGLLIMVPLALLSGILLWVILFYTMRYVSLASLGFAVVLPIAVWLWGGSFAELMFCIVLGFFIIVRHKSNILRLAKGQEYRFDHKRKINQ